MPSINFSKNESFLLECISDSLVCIDKDMQIIYANEAACSLFCVPEIKECYGSVLLDALDRKTAGSLHDKVIKAMSQGKPLHFEINNGADNEKWHDVHVYPSAEGATLLFQDITAKKKVENTIENQNKQLRLLSDAANHILLKSEPGELLDSLFKELADHLNLDVYINYMFNEDTKRLELMYYQGIDQSTAEDIHFLDLGEAVCGCVARDRVRIVEEQIDESFNPRVMLVKELGIKAYACYPLMAAGKALGTLSFGSRRRSSFTEDELDLLQTICTQVASVLDRLLLNTQLSKKKEEAETANEVKTNFLAMMSHELRTPLNSIIGFTQILQNDESDPLTYRQKQKVGKILNSSRHLLNLINELLELGKTNSRGPVFKKEAISVESIVQEPLRIIQPQVNQKRIRVYDRSQAYSYIHVLADATRVNQVMLNLLGNAVKYTPSGGKIVISCSKEGTNIKFTITDNGDGIPSQEQELVFEPFYRIFHQDNDIEGTGIGLTLVKQLVKQMGGDIGLKSALGYGSSFWFTLPIDSKHISYGDLYDPPLKPRVDLSDAKGKIIYIDDNRNDLALLEMVFEKYPQVQLIPALSGYEGIVYAASENRPDLILLDIHISDIHGFDVVEKLKNDPHTRDIPIIAVTADTSNETVQKLQEMGIRDYLTKPLDFNELFTGIKKYL
jgi:signal transduction histidine kinase/CheY-like chemotaxis protein